MQGVKISFALKAGLRRLWFVISMIWILFLGYIVLTATRPIDWEGILIIFGPPIILYALGAALAWVLEGFAGR